MKCPLDGNDLVIAERQGVEIDYCPKCRGVWLDRGELDKLIERSETYDARDRSRDRDDDRYDNDRSRDYERPRDDRYRDERNREDPYRKSGTEGIAGILGDALNKKMGSSDYRGHSPHKKKKGGLLGELFDF